jgi:hypothetical protein
MASQSPPVRAQLEHTEHDNAFRRATAARSRTARARHNSVDVDGLVLRHPLRDPRVNLATAPARTEAGENIMMTPPRERVTSFGALSATSARVRARAPRASRASIHDSTLAIYAPAPTCSATPQPTRSPPPRRARVPLRPDAPARPPRPAPGLAVPAAPAVRPVHFPSFDGRTSLLCSPFASPATPASPVRPTRARVPARRAAKPPSAISIDEPDGSVSLAAPPTATRTALSPLALNAPPTAPRTNKRKPSTSNGSTPVAPDARTPLGTAAGAGLASLDRLALLSAPRFIARTPPSRADADAFLRTQTSMTSLRLADLDAAADGQPPLVRGRG